MIVGFTGSRRGMSRDQQLRVFSLLRHFRPEEVRHGDCLGADEEFHELAYVFGAHVHIHPPKEELYRAFCKGDNVTMHPPEEYLIRDRLIVRGSDVLIGAPLNMNKTHSGSWYTINFAKQVKTDVYHIGRDGSVTLTHNRKETPWEGDVNVGGSIDG